MFSDPSGGTAKWMHWRKSNTSKQLLGFMRAVVEAMQADAQRGAPALPFFTRINMEAMLHGCIALLGTLFVATNSAALWPAMREWIFDHGGIRSVWAALAWSMTLTERERATSCTGPDGPTSEQYDNLSYTPLSTTFVCALALAIQLPRAASAHRLEDIVFSPGSSLPCRSSTATFCRGISQLAS